MKPWPPCVLLLLLRCAAGLWAAGSEMRGQNALLGNCSPQQRRLCPLALSMNESDCVSEQCVAWRIARLLTQRLLFSFITTKKHSVNSVLFFKKVAV